MTSAQVHERNALTVKGRKINWFESYYYDSWQVAKNSKNGNENQYVIVESLKIKSKKKRD